jgi:hypothetical protein
MQLLEGNDNDKGYAGENGQNYPIARPSVI